jgi:hypothetical protein
MINYCEEQRGNLRIVTESGNTTYMPTDPQWRLLGFDANYICYQYPNGQVTLFDESGRHSADAYLSPTDEIRNYANGCIYFRDTRLGINYRLDPFSWSRTQMV